MSNDWRPLYDDDANARSAPRARPIGWVQAPHRPAKMGEYQWDDDEDDEDDDGAGAVDEAFDPEALSRFNPVARTQVAGMLASFAMVAVMLLVFTVIIPMFDSVKQWNRERDSGRAAAESVAILYQSESDQALAAVQEPFEHPTIGIVEILVAGGDRRHAVLEHAIRRAAPDLDACYEKARADAPKLEGTLRFLLLNAGTLTAVSVVTHRSTIAHPELTECAEQALRRIRLPTPPEGQQSGGIDSFELSFGLPPNAAAGTPPVDPPERSERD